MAPATSAIKAMKIPSTDIHNNPFYCPAIPAHSFISSLRRKRENFRAKVHTYRNNRFVLRPFAAALDRCLFKGGGDSDSDNEADGHNQGSRWRRSLFRFKTESDCEEDSSEDELENVSFGTVHAHMASDGGFYSVGRSLASEKSTTLGSLGFKSKKDRSMDSDGFVAIPLATGKRDSALSSGNYTVTGRSGRALVCARRSRTDSGLPYSRTLTFWEKLTSVTNTNGRPTHTRTFDAAPTSLSLHLKRKSEESDDIDVIWNSLQTKRAKSNLSVSNSSFYVTVRREKLRFVRTSSTSGSILAVDAREIEGVECPQIQYVANDGPALRAGANIFVPRIKRAEDFPLNRMQDLDQVDLLETAKALQDELFGPSLGQESLPEIHDLVNKLDSILPGIRIKERLMENVKESTSAQAVVDFLAENGHLNARVLELFRASKVARISLDKSLKDADGLNLIGDDLFFVFSKPNSFRSLTTLFLDGLRLRTPMLTHIQHLPRLTILSLFDTGIDNEAIYLLVPLRYTLADLNVARNPGIDDDAVPALLILTGLLYLSIAETSVGMPGARRLVKDRGSKRTLVDLPHSCHEYVDTMDRKYLMDPKPPLITDPSLCCRLSVAALKRNLSSHAVVNRDIPTGGTKKEMVQRLEQLLEMRLADLEVRRMVRYPDQDDHDKMKKEERL